MREIKLSAQDRPVKAARQPAKKKPGATRKKNRKTASTGFFKNTVQQVGRFFTGIFNLVKSLLSLFTVKQKSKRRAAQNNWRKLAAPVAIVLAITVPVGLGGYYIVQNSVLEKTAAWFNEAANNLVVLSGLTVQEISVAGRERTSTKDMMAALLLSRGDNILMFDPEEARQRVEALGWVEHASIMRRFPDEVFIRITERRPFARWQMNKKTVVIDRKGAVVSQQDNREFRYLPKVVGVDAQKDAAELFDVLAGSPELFTRLQNAVRVRGRRWDLEFDNGITIMLPEEGAAHAWQRLAQMQRDQAILNKGVVSIDLRSSQKMYVRLKSDDAEFRRVAGKET